MKILHTSDWHIGQKLYGKDRYDEFQFFLNQLLDIINDQQIELLLVSGDIFDVPHPSNEALRLYYHFLSQLQNTSCRQTIITGGNHDSIYTLNAPKYILESLNVNVVGGVPEKFEDQVIDVKNQDGELVLQVAAVPFLRDKDLRKSQAGEDSESKEKAFRNGIVAHYQSIIQYLDTKVPSIAMGHLFAIGVSTSESERDIHVGNLGAVGSNDFSPQFNYVALGHIHKPQKVGGNEMIRYSGSPLPLSFSERKDQKSVVVLSLVDNQLKLEQVLPLQIKNELILVKGDLDEVKMRLLKLEEAAQYSFWIEVEVVEEHYSLMTIKDYEEFSNQLTCKSQILKYRFQFLNQSGDMLDYVHENRMLEDLTPLEVFESRVKNLPEDEHDKMLKVFGELLNLREERIHEN